MSDDQLVTKVSPLSVADTVARFTEVLAAKGVELFAVIDHSGEADAAGLELRDTKVVIFGSPKAGTPLMIASPTVAIDLPIKALVWEDADGRVWLSYNSPEYLRQRHGFPEGLIANIAGPRAIFEEAVRRV